MQVRSFGYASIALQTLKKYMRKYVLIESLQIGKTDTILATKHIRQVLYSARKFLRRPDAIIS